MHEENRNGEVKATVLQDTHTGQSMAYQANPSRRTATDTVPSVSTGVGPARGYSVIVYYRLPAFVQIESADHYYSRLSQWQLFVTDSSPSCSRRVTHASGLLTGSLYVLATGTR